MGGIASRRSSTIWVVAISQAAGFLVLAVLLPILPDASPERRDLWWGVLAGVFGGSGVALLYRALAVGVMSVVAPTTAVCAIVIPVVAGILLGERPSLPAMIGIGLAIVAIVLVSRGDEALGDGQTASPRVGEPGRSMVIAIVSGILIGLFLVALERPSPDSGLWPLLAARITPVVFFVPAAIRARSSVPRAAGAVVLITACGLLDMTANVLYTLAVRLGDLGIVATLASMYPASTVLLARIFLGERLRSVQWAGVICAGIAILLIVRG